MDWLQASTDNAVQEIIALSEDKAVFVFKHSPSCATSLLVLNRVEKKFRSSDLHFTPFLVNVIKDRNISMAVAEKWQIRHESPQVLIIFHGECIYHASHMNILLKEFPSPEIAV